MKDGYIACTRPLHPEDKYTEYELNPWKIEVRGHTLTSGLTTTLPPMAIGGKKRVRGVGEGLSPAPYAKTPTFV